jgi:hypothetical protein
MAHNLKEYSEEVHSCAMALAIIVKVVNFECTNIVQRTQFFLGGVAGGWRHDHDSLADQHNS